MEHIYHKSSDDFSVEIKAEISIPEQEKLVNALGHMVTSNLCLKDTKLLNTCLNLINEYSKELLSNLADYSEVNEVDMDPEVRDKLDDFSSINNFSL